MESKNVKVIDEHSIDRDASIICGFNLDGFDYVLYSIERDGDNDNLFVSKIIKNLDGTSNMVNIEDSMEKSKINDVVKELVTYSIKNENEKATDVVTLPDGKVVRLSGVLFNKEQNINVAKTYITTVKKSVTKVSEDFYKVEESKKEESSSIFETMTEPVLESKAEKIMPNMEVEGPAVASSTLEEKRVEIPELPKEEPVLPVEPVLPKEEVVQPEMVSVKPIIPVGESLPVSEPEVASELPNADEKVKPEVNLVEPSIPVASPVPVVETVTPVEPIMPVAAEPKPAAPEFKLFFDGSKETNLNHALNDVSDERTLPTASDGVESLREFGMDSSVAPEPSVNVPTESTGKVLTKSKGFANNKFFMVIAIVLFIIACVFLGYEAFHYFQLVK